MINGSNYLEQVNNLQTKEKSWATKILSNVDVCTKTRDYSRLIFLVSSVSYAASYVWNTPAVPTTITLVSGVVWGISSCFSKSLEPLAKKIVANVKQLNQLEAELSELDKQRREELASMIHLMFLLDQNMRFRLLTTKDTDFAEVLKGKIEELKTDHLIRLKQIIASKGWPGFSQAGVEGSHEFWLLVQHTGDLDFQQLCLGLLKEAVAKNDASKEDLAYLTDRVLMNLKLPQMYGTQIIEEGRDFRFYPIENEENVEERRKEMGLSTLAEYKSFVQKQYEQA